MNLERLQQGHRVPTLADWECVQPPNLDLERFHRGRRFFLDNLFSCALAMLTSLIAGLSVERLLTPLVFTHRSDTPIKSLCRYLRTFHYVVLWHRGDVWDPASAAGKSIREVHAMHDEVRNAMKDAREDSELNMTMMANSEQLSVVDDSGQRSEVKDLRQRSAVKNFGQRSVMEVSDSEVDDSGQGSKVKDFEQRSKMDDLIQRSSVEDLGQRSVVDLGNGTKDSDSLPVSQYDMSLVQCGFIGPIMMYPERFAIQGSGQDLADYCYFWYGIGHLLGITDENNICAGGLAQARQTCHEIEDYILSPALKNPPKDFRPMAQALIDGMNRLCRCRLFSLDAFLAAFLSESAPRLSLGVGDYLRVLFLQTIIFFVRYTFCRSLFNKMLSPPKRAGDIPLRIS